MRVAGIHLGGLSTVLPPSETAILMHFDNNYTDESTYNGTVTVAGGTPVFESDSKFGSHCLRLSSGYGQYHNIRYTYNAGLDIVGLKKAWQIDFWLKVNAGHQAAYIIRKNKASNSITQIGTSHAWSFLVNEDNLSLMFAYAPAGAPSPINVSSPTGRILKNVWLHCRAVSNGTQFKVFVDGIGGTAANISQSGIEISAYDLFIGVASDQFGNSYQMNTKIDEFRIKSGFDTFDDFTPPTAPFTV